MAFDAYDRSLDLLRTLAGTLKKLTRIDPDLARQLRRAAQSITLNISEANRRVGKDRQHLFKVALGSAAEVGGCLDVGLALEYVHTDEVADAMALLDRVRAMTYRLSIG
ncbi:MAG: four helix bundle protein [Myxococcota bacterium]|nr:four helix bundle protein [Myxococcota bacterium]